jgi:hypothetical protein
MTVRCHTAGVTVSVDSPDPQWLSLAAEACAGQDLGPGPSDVNVVVEPAGAPDRQGLRVVTRGALAGEDRLLLTDVCGSALDMEFAVVGAALRVRAWPRPTGRHR